MKKSCGEEKIIELFNRRDEGAIKAFESYDGGFCYRVALGITGDLSDAEECVNDLYLRLWNSIPPESPRSLRAYSAKIVRNLALNVLKKNNTQKRGAILCELDDYLDSIPQPEQDAIDSGEIGAVIDEFLAEQPEINALIFMRRYYYSDSVGNIAQITGFDENKVSRILSKMKKALKKQLAKGGITL